MFTGALGVTHDTAHGSLLEYLVAVWLHFLYLTSTNQTKERKSRVMNTATNQSYDEMTGMGLGWVVTAFQAGGSALDGFR
jgi:hypothetical protein